MMRRATLIAAALSLHLCHALMGGNKAGPGRFPYFTMLEVQVAKGYFLCGAALVHKDILVTAANCDNGNRAILATVNASSLDEGRRQPQYEHSSIVDQQMIHPDFRVSSDHDIMVLRLKKEAPPRFKPVQINKDETRPVNGAQVRAVGLGQIRMEGGFEQTHPDFLQVFVTDVVPHGQCNSDIAWDGIVNNNRMLCAGDITSGGKDACIGDSGGPLVVQTKQGNPDGDILVGVISSGSDICGEAGLPGLYTRVSQYADWIEDQICAMSRFKPSYCNGGGGGGGPGICFPATAQVQTEAKGIVPMSQLKIGDRVLVSSKGKQSFETVYSFGHKDEGLKAQFLQIHTYGSTADPLELSPLHLIFVSQQKKKPRAIPASQVQPGDQVVSASGEPLVVTRVVPVTKEGLYAPFTPSGTLVVNGVLTSSFASLQATEHLSLGGYEIPVTYHSLGVMFEAPHRLVCRVWWNLCRRESYHSNGISLWVDLPAKASLWYLKQHPLLSGPLFCLLFSLVVLFYLFERILSTPLGMAVLVLMMTLYHGRKKDITKESKHH